MNYLRAVILWSFGVVNTAVCSFLIAASMPIQRLLGVHDTTIFAHKIAIQWGRNFFRVIPGWRVRVMGKEHLPAVGQACVYIANHQSMTDIFAMYCVGVQFRWLSKAEVFKIPVVGSTMRRAGYIAVQRGQRDSQTKAMEASGERLKNGTPMFFFPEGTRSETGELRPFKSGAFRLAAQHNVPIIPVCLDGTRDLMVKGSAIPAAAHIRILILPALNHQPGEDYQDFADRAQRAVAHGLQQLKKDQAE